ncbi:MAG TPA: 3'-5' exonuclease [Halothiobacillaceae bacterium]|nr:3'-5' exonuclease [Halothiobacillaceae bacterium]
MSTSLIQRGYLWWLNRQLYRARCNITEFNPRTALLAATWPDLRQSWLQAEYLVLDFETTGLNPRTDKILSVGWVVCRGDQILLDQRHHCLVAPEQPLTEASVVIHEITDDQAVQGVSLEQALTALFEALQGRILVAHNARFELAFLKQAVNSLWPGKLVLPVIDTMHLAKRRLDRLQRPYQTGAMRLDTLRQAYGLPRYKAHHALIDALATAELFCAIAQHHSPKKPVCISALLHPVWF